MQRFECDQSCRPCVCSENSKNPSFKTPITPTLKTPNFKIIVLIHTLNTYLTSYEMIFSRFEYSSNFVVVVIAQYSCRRRDEILAVRMIVRLQRRHRDGRELTSLHVRRKRRRTQGKQRCKSKLKRRRRKQPQRRGKRRSR